MRRSLPSFRRVVMAAGMSLGQLLARLSILGLLGQTARVATTQSEAVPINGPQAQTKWVWWVLVC